MKGTPVVGHWIDGVDAMLGTYRRCDAKLGMPGAAVMEGECF